MSEVACCRLLPLSGFAAKPRPPDAVVLTHSHPVDQTRSLPHASRPHLPRRRRLAATPASRSGCRPRGAWSVRTCGRTNASAASHVRCAPTTRDHPAIMPSGVLQKCTSLREKSSWMIAPCSVDLQGQITMLRIKPGLVNSGIQLFGGLAR
jgi:hypothetical protein